jgi:hypothetical protein
MAGLGSGVIRYLAGTGGRQVQSKSSRNSEFEYFSSYGTGYWSRLKGRRAITLFYGQTEKEGTSHAKLGFNSNFSFMKVD